ncbi:DUF5123 domain-containing protein [Bacteroidota bacterium]
MKHFFKLIPCSILFLLMSVGFLNGQTVHQVAAGEDALYNAVEAAADGDIIELTTSGGVYARSSGGRIEITKKLTIRAAEGLAQKPIIRNVKMDETSARFFEIHAGGDLTLIGLDMDGRAEDGGAAHAKNCVRGVNDPAAAFNMSLRIYDCDLHDVTEKFILGHEDNIIDTLIVQDCFLYNAGKEGLILYESTGHSPVVDYVLIENCTFYNTGREAIKTKENDPNITINHCTFDNCGGSSKRLVLLQNNNNAVVKNSLFTNNSYTNFIKLYGNSQFIHNGFYNVDNISTDGDNVVISDTLRADPMYADPANLDFTLDSNSPFLGLADDGHALGDLRWDPNYSEVQVHKVEAGENTLSDAVEAAADGDIIELTSNGGLYTYVGSDKMYIDKSLTIRAREGLAKKPVLRNVQPGSSNARIFEIRDGGNLTLIGLELDGRFEDGGDAYAKNGIRNENVSESDPLYSTYLKIYDCYFHDFKEPFVKLHAYTSLDTLIVDNCILTGGGREGILVRESSSQGGCDVQYFQLTNSTMTNIGREALYIEFTDPLTIIDQCTFDNCGGTGDRILYPNKVTNAQISNSIFTNNGYSSVVKLYGNSSFTYNILFNVPGISTDGDNWTISDTLTADPMYADPDNGNYTLAPESPARTFSASGGPVGDLRWAIDPNAVLVSIITIGNGIVTLDPPGGVYDPGTAVTLTAVADPNWEFFQWEGISVFPPDLNPATITVNEHVTVTARFKSLKPQATLTLDVLGLGEVTANPLPGDEGTYDQGTSVTLTVTPAENWEFVEWTGDISSTENPVTFTLDSNMTVTASLLSSLPQVTLEYFAIGEHRTDNPKGSITVDPQPVPGFTTYDQNTVVTLKAEADLGWMFTGFQGAVFSDADSVTLTLDSDKMIRASFERIKSATGVLEVDDSWDLHDAVTYANNNSYIHTIKLTTSGGLYTSYNTDNVDVFVPLTIMGADDLEQKPVLTNSDPEKSNIDILRVFSDLTLKNVVLDAGHELSNGMKYGIRLRHYSQDSVKMGANIIVDNVDFINFFEGKNPKSDGHAFKIDVNIIAGLVKFENCTFTHFGYEAIRISDTEKWATDRAVEELIVRNCTFTDIDAECVRYYSDVDAATPDPPVLLEHITVNNSATRAFYLKNSGGAIVRDIIIANTRESGHGRDADLMDCQGNTDAPSYVSHINVFNAKDVPIKAADGEIDTTTIYNLDPEFEDPDNYNYTLSPTSPMFGLAHDGTALGDLNWTGSVPESPLGLENENVIPDEFGIDQNYPNPFNPSTTINFGLPVNARVTLKVYDVLGQAISTLIDNMDMTAGYHKILWNSQNMNGITLTSGLYIYRIEAVGENGKEFIQSMKMMFLK